MILTIVLAFFLVFMFQTVGGVMIGNIFYYAVFIKSIALRRSIRIIKSPITNTLLISFLIWAFISTLLFAMESGGFNQRNVIQFLFTMQYLVFIIDIGIDSKLLEEWLFKYSVMLSIAIIALYFFLGEFHHFASLYTTRRLWAKEFIPGWPNTTPIPLIFGLWLGMRRKNSRISQILMIVALILTSSRVALFGILAVYAYRVFVGAGKRVLKWFVFLFPSILGFALLNQSLLNLLSETMPSLAYRLSVTYDRQDIFRVTMRYISIRPFTGYGGNSIDQIDYLLGNFSSFGINWGHTHNWVLEILLRYGAFGLVLFSAFMISLLLKIEDREKKFMFSLMLLLGLFQTFMRNFNVLFLMFFLTMKASNHHSPTERSTVLEDIRKTQTSDNH